MIEIDKFSFIYGILLIAMGSCMSNNQELEQLQKEVIEIHDEVMPLMDPLYKIRKGLLEKSMVDSTNTELRQAITTIKDAEESMMNWMRNYDMTFKGDNPSETMSYFSEKKESIKQVAIKMNEALTIGEDLSKSKPVLSTD